VLELGGGGNLMENIEGGSIKERKKQLRKEGLKLNRPFIVVLVIYIVFSIYILFQDINFNLFHIFTGVVWLSLGFSYYKNKDFYRRVHLAHFGKVKESELKWTPPAFTILGVAWLIMGTTFFFELL
jgi:hypothetical protein